MGLWLSLTVLLNVLSAVLIVVVFALVKRQSGIRQDIQRLQKEWIQWSALGVPQQPQRAFAVSEEVNPSAEENASYISETQSPEPTISFSQNVRPRTPLFNDDWGASSGGGIREKAAKSLKSESIGEQPVDRFTKARELLRQGHGMKEVAVVTGLSYSELALLSKTGMH